MSALVLIRGMGSIGRRHARVFSALGARVVGWPVRPRGGACDGLTLLGDRDAVAVAADADLVVVCTDTARHVDDTLAALAAGARRILVEKPVASSVADVERLLAHPSARDRVAVAAPMRAHLGFRAFRASVNALDRPHSATVFSQSWLPSWRPDRDYRESYSARPDEGGALRDLIHEIDYALVVFGRPRRVNAVLEAGGPLDMAAEQGATLLWSTQSASVTVRVDYITRPARRGAVVTSPSGSVSWDPMTASVTTVDPEGRSTTSSTATDLDRDTVMRRQALAALTTAPDAPLAVRLDAGGPASLAEGVQAVQICDDARCTPSESTLSP